MCGAAPDDDPETADAGRTTLEANQTPRQMNGATQEVNDVGGTALEVEDEG